MPRDTKTWVRTILDFLSDHEWHTRSEVVAVGSAAVPPAHARRAWMKTLETARRLERKKGSKESTSNRVYSSANPEESGARMIANRTITNLTHRPGKRGRIELGDVNGRRGLRMLPPDD